VPSWVSSKGYKADMRNLADKVTVPYFGSSDCLKVVDLTGILFDSVAYYTEIVTQCLSCLTNLNKGRYGMC
jgi:hypothetical protein